ncbi:MAG: hypothetical protein U9Q90_08380 [Campylobacterota bacterium]|nr:hypothetical protein [Campylobacterota bacterium]
MSKKEIPKNLQLEAYALLEPFLARRTGRTNENFIAAYRLSNELEEDLQLVYRGLWAEASIEMIDNNARVVKELFEEYRRT